MADDEKTLFGPAATEIGRLRDDLRAIVAARWQLARLELSIAFADLWRLAIALAVAAVLALISLPVLIVAVADALSGLWGVSRMGWLLIEFAILVLAAVSTGWLGWRRFKRHFVGLEETLEVLREDQRWIESLSKRRKTGP
jgi:uncharacterized membrane protein YqjE